MYVNSRLLLRALTLVATVSSAAWLAHAILLYHNRLQLHGESQQKARAYITDVCNNEAIMRKLGGLHHCEQSRREVSIPAWELALLETVQDLALCGEHRCDVVLREMYIARWWLLVCFVALLFGCTWIAASRVVFAHHSATIAPLDPRYSGHHMPLYATWGQAAFCDPVYSEHERRDHLGDTGDLRGRHNNGLLTSAQLSSRRSHAINEGLSIGMEL